MGFTINVVLAQDLYPEKLPGDEPEPLEVVCWPLAELDQLIKGDEFREARAIAGLYLVRLYLEETRDLDESRHPNESRHLDDKRLGKDNAVPTTDTRVASPSTQQEKSS